MIKKIGIITCIIFLFIGCSYEIDGSILNFFSGKDRASPTLLDIRAIDAKTIEFTFDEVIFRPFISLQGRFKESTCSVYEQRVTIHLTYPLDVMNSTNVYLSVRDKMGNTTTIEKLVYGVNFSVPTLLINEFSTKGSGNNPDRVEIKALSAGNMAGVTIYHGMFFTHSSFFSFPSIEVEKGDYIVVQYQKVPSPQGLIYYGGEEGLGGNNGVISLYYSPYDDLADVVVYSNRTSDSDENYGGFGTREVYDQIQELTLTKGWTHQGIITPESAISSENSTATRSFNRYEEKEDTHSSLDWYIVPTSGSSFLEENNREVYEK